MIIHEQLEKLPDESHRAAASNGMRIPLNRADGNVSEQRTPI